MTAHQILFYEPQQLFGYPVPGGVRRTDPETSHLAAHDPGLAVHHGTQRASLLRAFASAGSDGLTDEQAGQKAYVRRIADTRRCSELRKGGLIAPNGERRKLSTGCLGMVSVITGAGLVALRDMTK